MWCPKCKAGSETWKPAKCQFCGTSVDEFVSKNPFTGIKSPRTQKRDKAIVADRVKETDKEYFGKRSEKGGLKGIDYSRGQ